MKSKAETERSSDGARLTGARCGTCAIVGRPNVGKSTLLNALLEQKLVIATPRPGTTRANVLGVYTKPGLQIAFIDTPGMHKPKSALGKVLVEEARMGLGDADVVLLLTDVSTKRELQVAAQDEPIMDMAARSDRPVVLAINKVDKVPDKHKLLPLLTAYSERFAKIAEGAGCERKELAAIVPVSATRKSNLEAIVREIGKLLPEGRRYEEDFLTDRPQRFFAAELVREAVLRHTREEVPYGVAVAIDTYEEERGLTRIDATILVEKAGHKKIVVGARGQMLKRIGTEARLEIERMIGGKVYLKLFVKVLEGWTQDPDKARRLVREGTL